MKGTTTVARETEAEARAQRILELEKALASTPANGRRRHALNAAIRIEAAAYRKSLDIEQASATHDPKHQPPLSQNLSLFEKLRDAPGPKPPIVRSISRTRNGCSRDATKIS